MARQKKLVGQMPMEFLLPETSWTSPTSLPDMTGEGDLAIDLETKDDGLAANVGPAWFRKGGFVTGVTITSDQRSVYAPVQHPDTECMDHDAVGRWLKAHMLRPRSQGRRFFHNAPYDIGWSWAEWGITGVDEIDDTMAMAFILDENRFAYGLDATCKWQGVPGKDETALKHAAEAYGFDPKSEMWKMPARYVGPYAEQDGVSTLLLGRKMMEQIQSTEIDKVSLEDAYRLEADLVPLCVEMRRRGVRINTNRAEETQDKMRARTREMLQRLQDHIQIGRDLHIDDLRSPKFMADVFTRLGIPYPKTDKGNDSFSNEWMSKFEGHPVPQLCSRALQFHDAAEKFIGNYILGFCHNGRIHAEIHQYKDDRGGTVTTRFSYSDPPLQQMPSRDDEIAKFIRSCFEPEQGEVWASIDYSQQEYRLIVHFAAICDIVGVDEAVRMYRENPDTDFHNLVVELTGLIRRRAKDCNFAKAFGAGIPKFALMTGMSLQDAGDAMKTYDEKMPFVARLAEFCGKVADRRGYIRMIDGARGRFDDWEPRWLDYKKVQQRCAEIRSEGKPQPKLNACSHAEAMARTHDENHPWFGQKVRRAKTHKAMNKLVQGSAARQMKMAMRACWREKIVPMLQMHDELDVSVDTPKRAYRVAELMETVIELQVPVKTDVEFGSNWGRSAKDGDHKPTWEAALADMGQ